MVWSPSFGTECACAVIRGRSPCATATRSWSRSAGSSRRTRAIDSRLADAKLPEDAACEDAGPRAEDQDLADARNTARQVAERDRVRQQREHRQSFGEAAEADEKGGEHTRALVAVDEAVDERGADRARQRDLDPADRGHVRTPVQLAPDAHGPDHRRGGERESDERRTLAGRGRRSRGQD